MMIARLPHTYAGWEILPWPSTTTTRALVSSYARTISDSSSPTMKSALIESSGTPYADPWSNPVWPVATNVAGTPAALSASVSRRAVVLFPIATSVPRTGIRKHGSLRDRSLNCFDSRIGRGLRTSTSRTPLASASLANSGSSFRYSCNPATMFNRLSDDRPKFLRDIAAKRGDADDQRLRPARFDGLSQARDDRDSVRLPVQDVSGVAPR